MGAVLSVCLLALWSACAGCPLDAGGVQIRWPVPGSGFFSGSGGPPAAQKLCDGSGGSTWGLGAGGGE